MFEALRGLRDAVAPESGNLGNNNPQNNEESSDKQQQPNAEELWALYQTRDEKVLEMTKGQQPFTSKAAFLDWYSATERQKDAALVEKLASAVLRQSAAIDAAVANLPGLHRTRAEQMSRLEQLMEDNAAAAAELETAHATAVERRNQCRQFVRDNTSRALGIEEE